MGEAEVRRRKGGEVDEAGVLLSDKDNAEEEDPELLLSDEEASWQQVTLSGSRSVRACAEFARRMQDKAVALDEDAVGMTEFKATLLKHIAVLFDILPRAHAFLNNTYERLSGDNSETEEEKQEEYTQTDGMIAALYDVMSKLLESHQQAVDLFARPPPSEEERKRLTNLRKRAARKAKLAERMADDEAREIATKYSIPLAKPSTLVSLSASQRAMINSDWLPECIEAVVAKTNVMRTYIERAFMLGSRPTKRSPAFRLRGVLDPTIAIVVAFVLLIMFLSYGSKFARDRTAVPEPID